jgi:hypothetical protein
MGIQVGLCDPFPAAGSVVYVSPRPALLNAGPRVGSAVMLDNPTAAVLGADVEALAMDQDMAVARRAAGHSSFLWLREL